MHVIKKWFSQSVDLLSLHGRYDNIKICYLIVLTDNDLESSALNKCRPIACQLSVFCLKLVSSSKYSISVCLLIHFFASHTFYKKKCWSDSDLFVCGCILFVKHNFFVKYKGSHLMYWLVFIFTPGAGKPARELLSRCRFWIRLSNALIWIYLHFYLMSRSRVFMCSIYSFNFGLMMNLLIKRQTRKTSIILIIRFYYACPGLITVEYLNRRIKTKT